MDTRDAALPDDLFFTETINSYLSKSFFLRRQWLAGEIDLRLSDPGCRFVVLTGEPGAGKSAFIAQFASTASSDEKLVYFIRRDQVGRLADASAASFFLRVGFQLAARRPELFKYDQLQIDVRQEIGTAAQSSEVVGAEIERLWSNPFYRNGLANIDQRVSEAKGKLVGLRIGEVSVSEYALAPAALLDMALVRPARALARLTPGGRLLVIVDGLDEEQYETGSEPTILRALANAPELPENLKFVLTSRPMATLALFVQKQAGARAFVIEPADKRVQEDVRRFAVAITNLPEVEKLISGEPPDLAAFVTKAVEKADGNIGYLDALARAIVQALKDPKLKNALVSLTSLSELPGTLRGIYGFFLNQIKSLVDQEAVVAEDPETGEQSIYKGVAWSGLYKRILATLAIAREPLHEGQIRALSGIAANQASIHHAIEQLRQFLDPVAAQYRLYHATLSEFLTSTETFADPAIRDLYVDPEKENRQLALRLEGKAGAASVWDEAANEPELAIRRDYGRRHLLAHLFSGQAWDALFAAVDEGGYGLGKLRQDPSGASYARDLDLARSASLRVGLPTAEAVAIFPRLWKYSVLRSNLTLSPADYAPETFGAMAALGAADQAERSLELLGPSELKAVGFARTAAALSVDGAKKATVDRLLRRSIEAALQMDDKAARAKALLAIAELVPDFVDDSMAEDSVLPRILQAASALSKRRHAVRILARVAYMLRRRGNVSAAEQTLAAAEGILAATSDCEERSAARAAYAEALSAEGEVAAAVKSARLLKGDLAIPGLVFAARVTANAGSDTKPLLGELRSAFCALPGDVERAVFAEGVATALHESGVSEEACEVLDKARQIAMTGEKAARKETLCSLARCYALIGRSDRANEVLADAIRIADGEEAAAVRTPLRFYLSPYLPIVETLAQLGRWPEALSRARALTTADRDQALAAAIEAMVAAGEIDRALEAERDLENMNNRVFRVSMRLIRNEDELPPPDRARKALILALAKNKRIDEAIEMAATRPASPRARAVAFGELAEALLQAGGNADARRVLLRQDEALLQDRLKSLQGTAMATIARLLIDGHVWECAKRVIARPRVAEEYAVAQALDRVEDPAVLHDLMNAIPSDEARGRFAANFARRLIARGKSDPATGWLEEAEQYVHRPNGQSLATLDTLADGFGAIGQREHARRLFEEGNALRRTFGRELLPGPIVQIAARYAKAAEWDDFERIVREDLQRQERPFALAEAARAAAEMGETTRATALAERATSAASELPVPGNSFGLVDVVRCYAMLGNWAAAEMLLDRKDLSVGEARDVLAIEMMERGRRSDAISLVRASPDVYPRAVRKLALALVSEGALAEASTWVGMMKDPGERHEAEVILWRARASTEPEAAKTALAALWQAAFRLPDARRIPPALRQVSDALVAAGQRDEALGLVQRAWFEALDARGLAGGLDACSPLVLQVNPEIGCGLFEGFDWCTAFLGRMSENRLQPQRASQG